MAPRTKHGAAADAGVHYPAGGGPEAGLRTQWGQTLAEALLARGADFIFMCKPGGPKMLYEYLKCVELEEFTTTVRMRGKHTLTYHYSWIHGVPLGDGKDALDVNWLAISLINTDGKTTYNGAFATSLEITRDNVEQVAACGRPRSKIGNETFNVLKNHGYNLAHAWDTETDTLPRPLPS